MALLTWEQYRSLYSLVDNQQDFNRYEVIAENEIRNVIGTIRWNDIVKNPNLTDEFYYEQLIYCICNVINYKATEKPFGITSASNDGYSESYSITTESASQNELRKNIRIWLSGTGLVGAY